MTTYTSNIAQKEECKRLLCDCAQLSFVWEHKYFYKNKCLKSLVNVKNIISLHQLS